jgi:SAM-dependent methyltransferase
MDCPELAIREIFRVLKPGGVCYFGARNKYFPIDGHDLIPFIAYLPKGVSDFIFKYLLGRKSYDIKLYSLGGLRKLTKKFRIIDYTLAVFKNPVKFHLNSNLRFLSPFAKIFYFLIPNYMWLLVKP